MQGNIMTGVQQYKNSGRDLMNNQMVHVPKGYKPSENEEYMNSVMLVYFKNKLLTWKDELSQASLATVQHLRKDDVGSRLPDITDQASSELTNSFELRTRNRYKKLIDKIDYSLKMVEVGEYGYCQDTGEPIGIKRLEARPNATLCIDAQEKHESYEKQHVDDEDSNAIK